MSDIKKLSSGAAWEDVVGYSRAVKAGPFIEIAGTTATKEDGSIEGVGNAHRQTQYILQKIEQVLAHFDTDMSRVIRTRMYVTDIAHWEDVGRAHGEFFSQIKPVATMVEVSNLIHRDMLVEIEVTAYVGG